MEVNQFDTLTRSLTGAGSRRRALALALGGLVTLGLVRSDDVAAGAKCKPKCPECKHCKKGKHGTVTAAIAAAAAIAAVRSGGSLPRLSQQRHVRR